MPHRRRVSFAPLRYLNDARRVAVLRNKLANECEDLSLKFSHNLFRPPFLALTLSIKYACDARS